MSNEKTCSNCGHWVAGKCHGSTPVPDGSGLGVWPATNPTDSCAIHSLRVRSKGKRSKASDGAVLRMIIDLGEVISRAALIAEIRMNFGLSRTAAVSRVNVMHGQGLIGLKGDVVTVLRPEMASETETTPGTGMEI